MKKMLYVSMLLFVSFPSLLDAKLFCRNRSAVCRCECHRPQEESYEPYQPLERMVARNPDPSLPMMEEQSTSENMLPDDNDNTSMMPDTDDDNLELELLIEPLPELPDDEAFAPFAEIRKKYTPEQRKSILQAMDEIDKLNTAIAEHSYNQKKLKELMGVTDDSQDPSMAPPAVPAVPMPMPSTPGNDTSLDDALKQLEDSLGNADAMPQDMPSPLDDSLINMNAEGDATTQGQITPPILPPITIEPISIPPLELDNTMAAPDSEISAPSTDMMPEDSMMPTSSMPPIMDEPLNLTPENMDMPYPDMSPDMTSMPADAMMPSYDSAMPPMPSTVPDEMEGADLALQKPSLAPESIAQPMMPALMDEDASTMPSDLISDMDNDGIDKELDMTDEDDEETTPAPTYPRRMVSMPSNLTFDEEDDIDEDDIET